MDREREQEEEKEGRRREMRDESINTGRNKRNHTLGEIGNKT